MRGQSDPGRGNRSRSPRMQSPLSFWSSLVVLGWGPGERGPDAWCRQGRIQKGLECLRHASPTYLCSLPNSPVGYSCCPSPIRRNWKGKMLIKGSSELNSIYLRWNYNILSCISFLSPFTWVIFLAPIRQCSVQFSHSVMSDSLQPHGPQLTRLPCPSPTPRAYPN